ncbi:restriction endonuclease [Duncaniella muris]|jgi:Predicted endonuclease distantly related to archaeal Holliday junction resolvase and Mrr-like restriction enzymes|uniref:restriction endonuclease n=1 Tax=Duncaniella muris TaxID=2094150 RepID=UPI002674A3B6|nr:restriction endonuclease [Duncaniella muris]
MTPQQYEEYIGSLFADNGYKVSVSPLSNDWGIDVIAIKGDEKIGIQAKMYGESSRSVNRRVIMELYGAAAYQDCTKAVLATDGEIYPDAIEVAQKLGIDILRTSVSEDFIPTVPTKQMNCEVKTKAGNISFEEAWEKYIFPLKGRILSNSRGSNKIIAVDWGGIKRVTSNGKLGKIDIEGFRLAYNVLMSQGYVTRDYINQQVDKRCSSGIVLILGELPFVEKTSSPTGLRIIE